jgi:hypothetical protein
MSSLQLFNSRFCKERYLFDGNWSCFSSLGVKKFSITVKYFLTLKKMVALEVKASA